MANSASVSMPSAIRCTWQVSEISCIAFTSWNLSASSAMPLMKWRSILTYSARHFRPDAQVRKALAEVVDGELVAVAAVGRQYLAQRREIGDVLVLGEFEDDLPRLQAKRV